MDHRKSDKESKIQRGLSRRAQLRQQQKTIELLNLRLESSINANHIHWMRANSLEKKLKEALTLTPAEKSALAHDLMQEMEKANEKICEIGACMHKEHQKC